MRRNEQEVDVEPASGRRALRWRRWWRRWTLRPATATVVILACLVVAAILSRTVVQDLANRRHLAQLHTIPVVSTQALVASITAGRVRTLLTEGVARGSWLNPRIEYWVIAKGADGHAWRVQSLGQTSASFWKTVMKASMAHPVLFRDGFGMNTHDDIAGTMLADMLFLLILVGVLIAAQRLVQEILVGGHTRPQKVDPEITLDAVIGHDAIKEDLRAFAASLNDHHRVERGETVPSGLLLAGDPGVGKTMLAAAMANEVGGAFFAVSGASFAKLYVGAGPERVRQLFRRARSEARAVIFIDEIDALGSRDTLGLDSERRATLNEILEQMDGAALRRSHLLLIGATNRPDDLDPALLRPGRFTRTIHLQLPTQTERTRLLRKYLGAAPVSADVDLERIARRVAGGTGATIRALVEEARRLAARRQSGRHPVVAAADFAAAEDNRMLGPTTTPPPPDLLQRIAAHELGHARVAHDRCAGQSVDKVTITPRGASAGHTRLIPDADMLANTGSECRAMLMMLMAGRAAERLIQGEASSLAQDDLRRATRLARQMVTQWGLGPSSLATADAWASQTATTPPQVLQQVDVLLAEAEQAAHDHLHAHRAWLDTMTQRLLEATTLSSADLFGDEAPPAAAPCTVGVAWAA